MVKIIVHRGTDAIGGTCIEVIADSGRLILDLGMPLMENGGGEINAQWLAHPSIENGILSKVTGLFDGKCKKPILGVLLSHAHPDHYGLLDFVHASIPIYMSDESKAVIGVGNIFYSPEMRLSDTINRCQTFKQNKPFMLGDFTITPYLIDHAAFGSSSFLIEVGGKRILYTGDIRSHGRKAYTFKQLPTKVGHIDCMLMEGTTLGGKHHVGFDSEQAVETGFVEHISHDNATFVIAAGGNVDRTVSLYRACKQTQKTLVIDLYQYYLLTKIKIFSQGLPPHDGDHLRVFFERNQEKRLQEAGETDFLDEAKPRKIFPGEIIQHAPEMVLRLSCPMMDRLANKMDRKEGMKFIYSMWQGYLDKGESGARMTAIPLKHGAKWQHVHTSGHAWLEDLQKLSTAINPDKLVPIHTLQGDDFGKYFDNVERVKDGEEIVLNHQYEIKKDFNRGISNHKAIEETQKFIETNTGKIICKLIRENKVIACIRNNYIDFYVGGCAILTYRPLAIKNKFKIHKKYLPGQIQDSVKSDKAYVFLIESNQGDDLTLAKALGFSFNRDVLDKPNPELKVFVEASKQKSFSEKLGIHHYINSPEQWTDKVCIDLEVAFSMSINGKRVCAKRVDLAWLEKASDGNVLLRLVEVKVDTDPRLRSSTSSPKVLIQMRQYEFFIGEQKDHIIESYKQVAKNYCSDFPLFIHASNKKILEEFINQQKPVLVPKPSLLIIRTHPDNNNWDGHYKTLQQKCSDASWGLYEYPCPSC